MSVLNQPLLERVLKRFLPFSSPRLVPYRSFPAARFSSSCVSVSYRTVDSVLHLVPAMTSVLHVVSAWWVRVPSCTVWSVPHSISYRFWAPCSLLYRHGGLRPPMFCLDGGGFVFRALFVARASLSSLFGALNCCVPRRRASGTNTNSDNSDGGLNSNNYGNVDGEPAVTSSNVTTV